MNEPLILVTKAAAVTTLTLNRPAAMNSLTAAMHQELLAALNAAADDRAVRCVVITGQGRGFCAGQDLGDPAAAPGMDLGALIAAHYKPLVQRLRSMPVPVIAAVNGVAAGAGANLALCCDVVIAGRSASFIQAFSKIGLVPDAGGTWLLPRLVGQARAMGLALLGDKLPALDAAAMGMIWQCVDDDALLATVEALAKRLSLMPTSALVATRKAMADAQGMSLDSALDLEAQLQARLGLSHDYLEGVDAFRAKRQPAFTDR
jgi:2-(1,2-epoxy-1,2-dihydrophenyl)acetyl-CoA isomerase